MDKPNIILINCDDLGYGDLGCYGSQLNSTPCLDKLAKDGIRFNNFYSASSICSPSRGSLMTGCYPPRIGFDLTDRWVLFPGDPQGIAETEKTMAQALKENGYRTKIIGKWHCGDQEGFLPCNRGFDEFYGLPYSNDMGRERTPSGDIKKCPPLPLIEDNDIIQQQPDQTNLTERYTEKAVQFIRKNQDKPFFLYFAHMYVHVPLFVPKIFKDKSKNGAYGAAVEYIDWSTSVLVDELKRLNLEENTIIIFTSDNGSVADNKGGSNGNLRGVKGSCFEGGFKVPCIIKWPNGISKSIVSDDIVSAIDLLPTLLSVSNSTFNSENKIDGVDISSCFDPNNKVAPRETFYYYQQNELAAVRHKDWKLLFPTTHDLKVERAYALDHKALYNLKDDVAETTNVYDKYPEIVEKLTALADEMRNDLGDTNLKMAGSGKREVGMAENPKTLTQYDINHPYMIALYDLND